MTRNLDLGSFLIKPPQRICKYPLLIKEALKNTATDHSDRAPLEAAMVKIQHIMTIINQGTPVTDLAKRAQEIQDSFTEVDGCGLNVHAHRSHHILFV